ncbi:hypothetical protein WFP14_15130 [Yersinia proxima]|uniref:Uncharacterized protein n=1 Tax=Yersinia proxima TaxID=2890316 RepID=A0ABW9F0P1_9GAMM|nr:Uncharacterised protein [Yersinia intermedia]
MGRATCFFEDADVALFRFCIGGGGGGLVGRVTCVFEDADVALLGFCIGGGGGGLEGRVTCVFEDADVALLKIRISGSGAGGRRFPALFVTLWVCTPIICILLLSCLPAGCSE